MPVTAKKNKTIFGTTVFLPIIWYTIIVKRDYC